MAGQRQNGPDQDSDTASTGSAASQIESAAALTQGRLLGLPVMTPVALIARLPWSVVAHVAAYLQSRCLICDASCVPVLVKHCSDSWRWQCIDCFVLTYCTADLPPVNIHRMKGSVEANHSRNAEDEDFGLPPQTLFSGNSYGGSSRTTTESCEHLVG